MSGLREVAAAVALPFAWALAAFAVTWVCVCSRGRRTTSDGALHEGPAAVVGAVLLTLVAVAVAVQVLVDSSVSGWLATGLAGVGVMAGVFVGVDARKVLGRRGGG